ncbi:MAG: hypothetical protein KKE71_00810, partial [Nanoarchaeota archaeon]|nr:hypothetical protein [Nanoarchaeota archaeon]
MKSEECLNIIISEILRLSKQVKCFIIGIGGGVGVGKTALVDALKVSLEEKGKKVAILHMDDFLNL